MHEKVYRREKKVIKWILIENRVIKVLSSTESKMNPWKWLNSLMSTPMFSPLLSKRAQSDNFSPNEVLVSIMFRSCQYILLIFFPPCLTRELGWNLSHYISFLTELKQDSFESREKKEIEPNIAQLCRQFVFAFPEEIEIMLSVIAIRRFVESGFH